MTDVKLDPVSWIIRRGAPVGTIASLVSLSIWMTTRGLSNDDTFFHLRIGTEFLNGNWRLGEPGSLTSYANRDWIPTQWLSQVAIAKVHAVAGDGGVVWLAGTFYVAYALTLYAVARRFAPPLAASLVALIVFVASAGGLSPRPQVVSYLLATLIAAAWLASSRDGKVRWWIIPATWLWAMVHGMWPIAVVISVAGAAGVMLDRRPPRREAIKLLLIAPAALTAACLTPLGPRLPFEVLTVTSRGEYFLEWGPTDFHAMPAAAVAAGLAFTLLVMLRSGSTSWTAAFLVLLAGGWAIYAERTVPVAAAILAPCAALALASQMPASPPLNRRGGWVLVASGFLASVALAGCAGGRPVGPQGISGADQELDKLDPATSVLNEWDWGGYLTWRHPDLDFVISGYGDMYTIPELDRNVALTRTDSGWQQEVKNTGVRIAVLATDSPLAYGLEHTAEWTVVSSSDDAVVLRAPE